MLKKKKKFLYVMICIICLGSLGFGNFYYNMKLENTANAAKKALQDDSIVKETAEEATVNSADVLSEKLTKNFPEDLSVKITEKINAGKTVKLAALGSESTSTDKGSWGELLQKDLDKAYGKGAIEVTAEGIKDDLSINIIKDKKYKTLLEQKPDILLIEPFLLNDNGNVKVEDTLGSLDILLADVKKISEDTTVMIQPPNPIYKPVFYLDQVNKLEEFTKENELIYLNHWGAWPDQNSEEMKMYVDMNTYQPTEKGEKVWAKYLINYFTGK
ncbi:hypothetical protein P4361_22750 [Fictibacillus sp. B-59209]|uniref:SGNH/GDSL hydrolase family protein n=1 Tax=Fictibacillus sp. B-59209 TaxID=3024873 RepID=UPI002E233223|nr:hypothetical protein [Fictibacillus sp. B-59209]